jgi:hypothetical protein
MSLFVVIPAKAGIQEFQSLALGPRFRGGDDLAASAFLSQALSAG